MVLCPAKRPWMLWCQWSQHNLFYPITCFQFHLLYLLCLDFFWFFTFTNEAYFSESVWVSFSFVVVNTRVSQSYFLLLRHCFLSTGI